MEIKDFKEYLNTFKDSEDLGVIIANPTDRKYYPISDIHLISDMACICFEVGASKNMDEENLNHTTLEDQMELTDFI